MRDGMLVAYFMLQGHEEIRERRVFKPFQSERSCSMHAVRLFVSAYDARDRAWRLYAEAANPSHMNELLKDVVNRDLSMTGKQHDCPFCMCGRRAPMQASERHVNYDTGYNNELRKRGSPGSVPGSIAWEEHELVWIAYASQYPGQSALRMAERGGFSYSEFEMYLRRSPTTWRPEGNREARDAASKLAWEQKVADEKREKGSQ